MDKRKAKKIAYGIAADLINSSDREFMLDYEDEDREKIEAALKEIVMMLNARREDD